MNHTITTERYTNYPKTYTITDEDIDDIMSAALDSISYWCDRCRVDGDYLGEYASEQISRGGRVFLRDADSNEECMLDLEALLNGIKLAIEDEVYKDYEWYNNGRLDCCMVDGDAADAIVQYALFDECIYG